MDQDTAFVPTPTTVADYMAASVFGVDRPEPGDRILFPGMGTGRLYDAVGRYTTSGSGYIPEFDYGMPHSVGVEMDADLVSRFESDHPDPSIDTRVGDFLTMDFDEPFDYVIANPPYIHLTNLPEQQRDQYERLSTAYGQYNLYYLFFEKAISLLKHGGTLTFLTPIQYLTTQSADPLRQLLLEQSVAPLQLMPEPIFDETVQTMITTLRKVENAPPDFFWNPPHESQFTITSLYRYEFDYLLQDRSDDRLQELWRDYVELSDTHCGPMRTSIGSPHISSSSPSNQDMESHSQSDLEAFS